jgi:hypothetical protein
MENNENKYKEKEIVIDIDFDIDKTSKDKRDKEILYKNIKSVNDTDNSNIRNNQDIINDNISQDREVINNEQGFEIPINLKKTYIFTLILFILGLILIGIGFIEDIQAADPFEGITFWIVGSIVLIPGGYYTYQFCKARRSMDIQERENILNDIPEL